MSENLFRVLRRPGVSVLDLLPYPLAALDEAGRTVWANAAFCAHFDVRLDQVVGRLDVERLQEAEQASFLDHLREWQEGKARPLRLLVSMKSGEIRPHLLVPAPIPDASGKIVGTLLVVLDEAALAFVFVDRMRSSSAIVRSVMRTLADEIEGALARMDREPAGGSSLRRRVPALASLTDREWQIAHRIGRGDRVAQVAKELRISAHTVRNHLKAVFRKTGASSQTALLERFRAWRGEA